MLSAALLVLACVGGSLSQPYPSHDGYGKPTYEGYGGKPTYEGYGGGSGGGGGKFDADINNLIKDVTDLISAGMAIDERISYLTADNEDNTFAVDDILNEIIPGLFKAEDKHIDQITDLERQAELIILFTDDIALLNNTVREAEAELAYLTGPALQETLANLKTLRDADAANDAEVKATRALLAENDARLTALEARHEAVKDLIRKIRSTFHQVFDALNSEQAETFDVVLTADKPEVTTDLRVDFSGRRPEICHGYKKLHVSYNQQSYVIHAPATSYGGYGGDDKSGGYGSSKSDGYGSSKNTPAYGPSPPTLISNPALYWNTDVHYDQKLNRITTKLFDLSQGGYKVERVVLGVTVLRIDDRIISTYDHTSSSHLKQA